MRSRKANRNLPMRIRFPLTKEQFLNVGAEYIQSTARQRGIDFNAYIRKNYKRITK